jgi:N-acetylglucosaminyl-diphospho-decaprenol L-rhamnosyltransferase
VCETSKLANGMNKNTVPDIKSTVDALKPALSILIITWNSWPDIKKCLESIRLSDFTDFEIVVIDNNSTDETVAKLQRYFPEVRLYLNQSNVGHARAVNRGFGLVRGDYVLLLDADTELAPETISKLMSFMRRRNDVSVAAPRTFNTDGSIQESARSFPTAMSGLFGRQSFLTRLFPNNRFSKRYLQRDKLDESTPFQVEQVAAACMIFPRSLVAEAGPWDEGYFAYWVDTDWCMRLKQIGKKIFCIPQASVIHHEKNRSNRKKSLRRIWSFHSGAFRLYRKHCTFGMLDPRTLMAAAGLSLRAALLSIGNYFAHQDEVSSGDKIDR